MVLLMSSTNQPNKAIEYLGLQCKWNKKNFCVNILSCYARSIARGEWSEEIYFGYGMTTINAP